MSLPEKLPIERVEDYHTHYLGSCSDGRLFWGYETFFYPEGKLGGQDWQKHRREYIILHTFDEEGNYLDTKNWFAGTTAEVDNQATLELLEEWVAELGEVDYHDIEVKLFQVVIDGVIFGLIPSEENQSISLQPSSTISFYEPWDGAYYT